MRAARQRRATTALPLIAAALLLAGTLQPVRAAASPDAGIDIGAMPLDRALKTYGIVTGRQLLYGSALVAGRTASAVHGAMSADEALRHLLSGTGLSFHALGPRVVVLTAGSPATASHPAPSAEPSARHKISALQGRPEVPAVEGDIVVTGSHIRGAASGSSPVETITRDDIDRGGYGTAAQAIAATSQNFIGAATEQSALTLADGSGNNSSLATGANLRGLGPEATLVLVDGKRLAGSGTNGDFADISSLPTAAVDRVEILLDGASALYGSDAVGGVVNVILKDHYDGAETRVRLGTVTKGGLREAQIGQIVGKSWATGNIFVAYEYEHRSALASASRRYARSSDLSSLGGTDRREYYSLPGNVLEFDPTTGSFAPSYAIPNGQDGSGLTADDFLPGAVNLENQRENTDLIPRQTRNSVYVKAKQEISSSIRISADARYTDRRYAVRGTGSPTILAITAANPYFVSPTGSDVDYIAYSFGKELGPSQNSGSARSLGLTGDLTADLGGDWQARSYLAYATEHETSRVANIVNGYALAEALGTIADDPTTSFDPATDGFFNPYGNGKANGAAILGYVGEGFQIARIRTKVITADSEADGTLFRTAGGAVKLALGVNYRRESFGRTGENFLFSPAPVPGSQVSGARNIVAGFAELRLPLVGKDNSRPGIRELELSAAARIERYSDFGSTTNPKVGVTWTPVAGLRLRSSFGTSFRAPGLRALRDQQAISADLLTDIGGSQTAVLLLSGGNGSLGPEKARSWTAGFDLTPSFAPGLRLNATWFQTIFDRRVGLPVLDDLSNALINPALSSFVDRVSPATDAADYTRVVALINDPNSYAAGAFPPEAIGAIIDTRYVNTGRTDVSGLDLMLADTIQAGQNRFDLAANGSYLFHYRERITPTAASTDELNLAGRPVDFKGRASVSWERGPLGANVAANYVDHYHDLAGRRISSWTTIDAQLSYTVAKSAGPLAGLAIALNVQNLFDRDPPFYDSPAGVGYDAANADALGRYVSLQLSKRW